MKEDGAIRSTQLGAATRQFESWQKPLAQFVLSFSAVVAVVEEIFVFRGGKDEARDVVRFLE
eukprot:7173547-Lingulodinium_polyedra.AAC.1